MDPKWVMTNEQKKIRFQHYFKKKQEREATGSTTTTSRTERYVNMVFGAVMTFYHRVWSRGAQLKSLGRPKNCFGTFKDQNLNVFKHKKCCFS
jgi:hypothetical protein